MNDRRNTFGQAYGLTVLTPIAEGRESGLARHLNDLEGGDASPLARVPGTHFARWVLIGDVVYEGSGKRDHLSSGRLLFTSNFDSPLEPYLETLRTAIGEVADAIWGHCAGYPGSGDAAAFAGYLRGHQLESSLFFAAYGDRTVAAEREAEPGFAQHADGIRVALAGALGHRAEGGIHGDLRGVTTLDLPRIQGFVVRGYRLPLAGFLFLRIDDAAGAAAWIATITEDVVTAAPWSEKPESGVNVAFTYAGLRSLGLPDACLAGFPEEFRQGMAARAELIGDSGESAPPHWEGRFGTPDIHVLVMISAADRDALAAHDGRLRASIDQTRALTLVDDDVGAALATRTEHFGYADGFAQPSIEGSGVPELPGKARSRRTAAGDRSRRGSSYSVTPTRRACCRPHRRRPS